MKFPYKGSFFWTYATASIFLLIIVIGLHSLWQIQRSKSALYDALYDQGNALVESLQSSGKNAIISYKLAQDILVNRLLDNARLIDSLIDYIGLNGFVLKEVINKNNLFRVQVVDYRGRIIFDSHFPAFYSIINCLPSQQQIIQMGIAPILRGEQPIIIEGTDQERPTKGDLFWVALARKKVPGAIIIHVDARYMDQFRREIGLGKLIEDVTEHKGIRYISFQDQDNCLVAPAGINLPKINNINYFSSNGQAKFYSLSSATGNEIYEIIKPFIFQGKTLGIFRIGLSLDKFTQNIRQTQKKALWFSFLVILLGSSGLIIIFYRQHLQLRRQKRLEENFQRSERLHSLGKLAAGVAHEIRNPLNAIGMSIQRLQHEYLPDNEENKKEFLHFTDVIREEVSRVDKIISNFLTFAKEPKLEWQQVDIKSLIEDLGYLLSSEAGENNCVLHLESQDTGCYCVGDINLLKQAFLNLIQNAIQAMPNGGKITIKINQLKESLLVSIQDSGTGINDTSKIFELYYTTKEGGVGLGLPISQRIIEEHGGKIEVISQIGEGSEFRVILPTNHPPF